MLRNIGTADGNCPRERTLLWPTNLDNSSARRPRNTFTSQLLAHNRNHQSYFSSILESVSPQSPLLFICKLESPLCPHCRHHSGFWQMFPKSATSCSALSLVFFLSMCPYYSEEKVQYPSVTHFVIMQDPLFPSKYRSAVQVTACR